MKPRLATADYSFPLLAWEQSLRLAADLGFDGVDISLFGSRSQLKPDQVLQAPQKAGRQARNTVTDNGLSIADVFGIPGATFDDLCPNHPEAAVRNASRDYFNRILEFAVACEAHHLSILPGIAFDTEPFNTSFARCADELGWRALRASEAGITLSVEAHIGSIIHAPLLALRLLEDTPGLTLTLDLGHFVAQGFNQLDAEPLLSRVSHVHARGGRRERLQESLKHNTIDFSRLMKQLNAFCYTGWYAVEYVWIDWEHCNEVDNLSETIMLRDLLRSVGESLD
jgi:sugar phosphate isomerase/epimerase